MRAIPSRPRCPRRASHALALALGAVIAITAAAAHAQSDQVELCDGLGSQVVKPVGDQQWLIYYSYLNNTANGAVLLPDGSTTFVSCFRTLTELDTFEFECTSPDPNDSTQWVTIATDVALPTSFFGFPNGQYPPDVARFVGQQWAVSSGFLFGENETFQFDLRWEPQTEGDILRGVNAFSGNPVAITPLVTADRDGEGPFDYIATEFFEDGCFLLNVNVIDSVVVGFGLESELGPGGGCGDILQGTEFDIGGVRVLASPGSLQPSAAP